MIKSKFPKQLIKERLSKIEEAAPNDKPFIIFIEQSDEKNKWIVIEQHEALHKKTKSRKFTINDLKQYMKNNSDIPILVDYEIDDNNIVSIWHILLQLANEEELEILVNYMIELIDKDKKNIKFTRYLMKLTQKYKEQFLTVNMDKSYDRLNCEQLERLIKVMKTRKVENKNE